MSPAWIEQLQIEVNRSEAYASSAKTWEGDFHFIVEPLKPGGQPKRMYLDLWTANRQQLALAGVNPANIETAEMCSICDQRFWSHRRDGETAGRTALFIGLR
jgi:copper oxidase (laccase) domain-containing protein